MSEIPFPMFQVQQVAGIYDLPATCCSFCQQLGFVLSPGWGTVPYHHTEKHQPAYYGSINPSKPKSVYVYSFASGHRHIYWCISFDTEASTFGFFVYDDIKIGCSFVKRIELSLCWHSFSKEIMSHLWMFNVLVRPESRKISSDGNKFPIHSQILKRRFFSLPDSFSFRIILSAAMNMLEGKARKLAIAFLLHSYSHFKLRPFTSVLYCCRHSNNRECYY